MDRAASLILALVCIGCTEELPPLGEAIIVVDTDLPVPALAGDLRLDLYGIDDTSWYHSREIALPDPRDWPASFSIYNPDPDVTRVALVRVRVHPLGRVRDYHGERFAPVPVGLPPGDIAPEFPAPGVEEPRLVVDGSDVTPDTEPQPFVTIDRLFVLRLEPGRVGSVRLLLRGACVGTMADLFGHATCIDTRALLTPAEEVALADDVDGAPSVQGSFAPRTECSEPPRPAGSAGFTPLHDEEVCVPGGAFMFGNSDVFGTAFVDDQGDQQSADGVPERIAVVPAVRMDRYEVTVARWRKARVDGFISPDITPIANEGAINPALPDSDIRMCTWSVALEGREEYPVTCVSAVAARAFCKFVGGDLPSEAEWEHAAQAAGRDVETRYPWGADEPTCDRAIFGRLATGSLLTGSAQCVDDGPGPHPVNASEHEGGDVSLGLGIVQLGGGVAEYMRDDAHPLTANCWVGAPLESPTCIDPTRAYGSLRGGTWNLSSVFVHPGFRLSRRRFFDTGAPLDDSWVGFRCMRTGGG